MKTRIKIFFSLVIFCMLCLICAIFGLNNSTLTASAATISPTYSGSAGNTVQGSFNVTSGSVAADSAVATVSLYNWGYGVQVTVTVSFSSSSLVWATGTDGMDKGGYLRTVAYFTDSSGNDVANTDIAAYASVAAGNSYSATLLPSSSAYKVDRIVFYARTNSITSGSFSGVIFESYTAPTVKFTSGSGTGSDVTVNNYKLGETVTLPSFSSYSMSAPTGYHFSGWNDGSSTYSAGSSYRILSDTTFTAKYSANSCTVIYSSGTSTSAQSYTYDYGTTIQLASCPSSWVPSGKYFSGWNDGSKTYSAGASYTITGATTFTATFSYYVYTVTYSAGDGTGSSKSYTYNSGTDITLISFPSGWSAPTGKYFSSWNDGSSTYSDGASVTVTSDKTFTATYEAYVFGYGYAPGEGSGTAYLVGDGYEYGTSITLLSTLPSAFTAPTGKYLIGWNDGSKTYDRGASYTLYESVTFTAVYTYYVFTLTYMPGEGTGTTISANYNSGYLYTLPGQLPDGWSAPEGEYLSGWTDGTNTYSPGLQMALESTVVYTAKYSVYCNVTYAPGEGTGTSEVTEYASGTKITLPSALLSGWSAPTGHYFSGTWTDGTNTYNGGASVTITASIMFTAVYTAESYQVTYYLEGFTPLILHCDYGTEITIGDIPDYWLSADYEFLYWTADGTTDKYYKGDSYTVEGNVTFTPATSLKNSGDDNNSSGTSSSSSDMYDNIRKVVVLALGCVLMVVLVIVLYNVIGKTKTGGNVNSVKKRKR